MDPAGCVETYDDEFFLLSPEMFQQVECVSGWESECVSKESRKKSDFFGDPTTLALIELSGHPFYGFFFQA